MFEARCDSAKPLVQFLTCLRFSPSASSPSFSAPPDSSSKAKTTLTTIYVTEESVTFRIQGKVYAMASIVLSRDAFDELRVEEGEGGGGGVCADLNVLLDCLHVLGNTSLEKTR